MKEIVHELTVVLTGHSVTRGGLPTAAQYGKNGSASVETYSAETAMVKMGKD